MFFDELAVQQDIADRRMDQRRPRRDVGVGLVLRAEQHKTGEPLHPAALRDLGEIGLDAGFHLFRRVGGGRLLEIGASDFERPHAEIKRADLELNPRQVRVEQQHALERGDCRLVIAQLGRDIGIGEGRIEVARIAQHFLEQRCLLRLQLGPLRSSQRLRRCRAANQPEHDKCQQQQALQPAQFGQHIDGVPATAQLSIPQAQSGYALTRG